MNVNIYLEDALGKQLSQCAKNIGKSRNNIIRDAIKKWLETQGTRQWPSSVLSFKGSKKVVPFEASRQELLPPKENPFA